ncbi:MAG: hypothetical protein AMS18_04415, partial [Gemmatimonas sp. SG8_17]
MSTSRRDFFKVAAGTAGAVALGATSACTSESSSDVPEAIR